MSFETTPPHATGYMLLFRKADWLTQGYSEDEIREVMEKVNAWFDRLTSAGKVVSSQPLLEEAVIISGRSVTDGPFAEAKEAVGGFVLLSVGSMEEAVAIAKSNPMNDYGLTTEVRATASACPSYYRLVQRSLAAVA